MMINDNEMMIMIEFMMMMVIQDVCDHEVMIDDDDLNDDGD